MSPRNSCGGGGRYLPSIVMVAPGEPGVPGQGDQVCEHQARIVRAKRERAWRAHDALGPRAASQIGKLHTGHTSVASVGLANRNDVSVAVWIGYDNADGKRRTLGGGLIEGDTPVSTPSRESCKNPSHELVERRRTFRSSRLSPWQSERGLNPR